MNLAIFRKHAFHKTTRHIRLNLVGTLLSLGDLDIMSLLMTSVASPGWRAYFSFHDTTKWVVTQKVQRRLQSVTGIVSHSIDTYCGVTAD